MQRSGNAFLLFLLLLLFLPVFAVVLDFVVDFRGLIWGVKMPLVFNPSFICVFFCGNGFSSLLFFFSRCRFSIRCHPLH